MLQRVNDSIDTIYRLLMLPVVLLVAYLATAELIQEGRSFREAFRDGYEDGVKFYRDKSGKTAKE